jgi:hypothetical protein
MHNPAKITCLCHVTEYYSSAPTDKALFGEGSMITTIIQRLPNQYASNMIPALLPGIPPFWYAIDYNRWKHLWGLFAPWSTYRTLRLPKLLDEFLLGRIFSPNRANTGSNWS